MQTEFLTIDGVSVYTSYRAVENPRPDGLTAVLLHGAGTSTSERYATFSQLLVDHGISVVGMDFVGHGYTGGLVSNNSLNLRTKHALAAIRRWTEVSVPLILCGSSMSGHTALRVAAQLGNQVKSLFLMMPAVYAAEAEDVCFGPEFTAILREFESWRNSPALQDAAAFEGKALIVIGAEDKVIPWGVIEALVRALKQNATELRLKILGGVGHEIPTWIPAQPQLSQQLMSYLLD